MAIQQSKQQARVVAVHKKTGKVVVDTVTRDAILSTWGAFLRIPAPSKIGSVENYIVTVERLEDLQFKRPYAKRLAESQRSDERAKKRQQEQYEAALVLRQQRIMNQIELAFEKKGKDAVKFVTCDTCEAPATVLGLTHETPGSAVISPDQITGAMCGEHNNKWLWPFKTKAVIECSRLEFFYDGLRQIYVNKK